jgi:pimeloyl-ACP methyl ester carboxylesterase
MRGRRVAACLAAVGLSVLGCGLGTAASASAKTVWLCRPSVAGPCNGSLTATVLSPDEAVQGVQHTAIARQAPIDCFYVYPTVSDQPGLQADLTIDQAVRSAAHYEASRFSSVCRVWAPVYRQVTLAGLLRPAEVTPAMRAQGYADVLAAWRDYLAHDNHGRGVVLIGHSQGTAVLSKLIAQEIDRRPAVRRRLVSALLLGGNVTVAKGSDRGGSFANVPACRRTGQVGCVVAYSTFNDVVPADSAFGRTTDPALEVLCTNPAALGGGSGTLQTYDPTTPFGGTIGIEIEQVFGTLPTAATPWIHYRGAYAGACSTADGANVLQITGAPGARVLHAVPAATWGLHLADMNIAMGNLTAIVAAQAKAHARR